MTNFLRKINGITGLAAFLALGLFASPASAELMSSLAACSFHVDYQEEPDLCAAISVKRDVERMRGFTCRIMDAKTHEKTPVLDPNLAKPIAISKDCTGDCLEAAAFSIRAQLFALSEFELRAGELKERFEFAERVAAQSANSYASLLARLPFIQKRLADEDKIRAAGGKAGALRSCRMRVNSQQADVIRILQSESEAFKKLAAVEAGRFAPAHAEAVGALEKLRSEVAILLRDRCVAKNTTMAQLEKAQANANACRTLRSGLADSTASITASVANLGWSFFSEDPADKFRRTQTAFHKHPGLRYFMLERSDVFKSGARQVIGLISALQGVSNAEKEFLEALFSEKTTDAELEFLISPNTLRMLEQLTAATDGLGRLRLYKDWSENNTDLANAFRRFVKANYEKFRMLIAEAVAGSEELGAAEKDLFRAIILSDELKDSETTFRYVELMLNIATASLKDDPLAIVREIGHFAWNPNNETQVKAAKSLLKRNHAKVQAVTIEALRKFSGPIRIDGKNIGPAQLKLLETIIEKSRPEDFELVLDFSLSLARDSTVPGKLNILKSLAADPRALGLTRDFFVENHEIFRSALLETLAQYDTELTDGDKAVMTKRQLEILRMLIERSTGPAIARITSFVHRVASTREDGERTEILLGLLSDPDVIAETKAFTSDAANHRVFIGAALDTLKQFEREMTDPRTGFAKPSQVALVRRLLEKSTPAGTARAIDIAHDLVKARGSAAQLEVLRRVAGDRTNTDTVTEFIRNPGNLELLKQATLDTLAQQEKELVGKGNALSRAQYDLLRDLIDQVTPVGATILVEYVGRFARAKAPGERLALLQGLLADAKIVASAKDYAGDARRLGLIRQAALDALETSRKELLRPGVLTIDQFRLVETVIRAASPENVRGTLEVAHRLTTTKSPAERLALVRELLDQGASGGFRSFMTDPRSFAQLKKAALDTMKQFRAEITDKKDGFLNQDQYLLLAKIVEELEPKGALKGIDYARAWLAADKPEARKAVIHSALTDSTLLDSAAGFLARNHALTQRALVSSLRENRESLVKNGMTEAQWRLALTASEQLKPRDAELAVNFVAALSRARDLEGRMKALENYFRAYPEAGARLEDLVRSPLLESLRAVLLDYIAVSADSRVARDYLLALVRGATPEGIAILVRHRLLLLSSLRDTAAPVDPEDRCSVLEYLLRVKNAFRKHPAELRAIFETNVEMLSSLARVTIDYLDNDIPVSRTNCAGTPIGPAKPLKSSMDPDLRRGLRAFLRGITGSAKLAHPDPSERGPFRVWASKNQEAADRVVARLARETGMNPVELAAKIRAGTPIRVNGQATYPTWEISELGMKLTRDHVFDLAEYYLERLGTLLRKGQELTPAEVALANRQVDHLVDFLKESKEGEEFLKHALELKRNITVYVESGARAKDLKRAPAGKAPSGGADLPALPTLPVRSGS